MGNKVYVNIYDIYGVRKSHMHFRKFGVLTMISRTKFVYVY